MRLCLLTDTSSCEPGQFKCRSKVYTLYCIDTNYVCNGIRDCPGGSDETVCKYVIVAMSHASTLHTPSPQP